MKSLRILTVLFSVFVLVGTNLCAMECGPRKRKLSADQGDQIVPMDVVKPELMEQNGESAHKRQKRILVEELGTYKMFQHLLVESDQDTFATKARPCIDGFSKLISRLESKSKTGVNDAEKQEILEARDQLHTAHLELKAKLLQVEAEMSKLICDVDVLMKQLANLTV
jgi:hypothetical protein